MATYLILNTCILVILLTAVIISRTDIRRKPIIAAIAGLTLLTIIFDNVIISAGIVAYDTARISGWYIVKAPVEDFAYTIAAVLVASMAWRYGKRKV